MATIFLINKFEILQQERDNLKRNWTNVNGLRLHALVSKGADFREKFPVILIQGLGISSNYMIPLMREMRNWSKVYALDFPGFGESEKPWRVFNIAELAEFLADWMSAFGIKRAVLIGHSFGCQVIAEFALRYPEMIERIVFAAPTIDRKARNFFQQFGRLLFDSKNEPFSLISLAWRDYFKFGFRREVRTLQYALRDAIEKKLPAIAIPALVVRGEFDTVVPADWSREVAELLPQGKLITIGGGTHGVVYQSPQKFAAAVREFIDY